MKKLLMLILVLSFVGCVANIKENPNIDYISMGIEFTPTNPENMQILTENSPLTKTFTHIGLIRIKNVGASDKEKAKALEQAREYAAMKGASAILIREVFVSKDEGGTDSFILSAYAIKYKDDLQEEDKQMIEKYENNYTKF